MNFNLTKLMAELRAAGLDVVGVSDSQVGRVDFPDGTCWRPGDPTPDARTRAAAAVIAAHDPGKTRAQRLSDCGCTEIQAALVLVTARGDAAPEWARSTVAAMARDLVAALG